MRLLVTALAITALLVTGCGGDDGGGRESGPTTLQPAATGAPEPGTQRFVCPIATDDGPISFQVDLPVAFHENSHENGRGGGLGCSWSRPLDVKTEFPGEASTILVGPIDDGDDGLTVQEIHDQQAMFLVEDDDFGGDDATYDLELTEDRPTFGPTIGDRVSWRCYCDGAPDINYVVQADGVELSWSSVPDIKARTERELDAALVSAGLVS